MKSFYNPPKILKKAFSKFIWESAANKILFTFDDGPIPEVTELILRELANHSIKSVFFCVGNNIEKYSSLAQEIISEGHTIGNHTFNHKRLIGLSKSQRYSEIESCSKVIKDSLAYDVKYFRPPHGRFNFNLAKELQQFGLTNVMWSLLTYDFKSDIELVKKSVKNYLLPNSIVVFHDNVKVKNIITDSINIVLEEASKKNYQIGTPEECLK